VRASRSATCRKFNIIAVAGGRDNLVHAEINDLGFIPAYKNDHWAISSSADTLPPIMCAIPSMLDPSRDVRLD